MNFVAQKNFSQAFIMIAAMSIIGLILWNTSLFFERLKNVERDKMEIWAQSQKSFSTEDQNDYLELNLLISRSNNNIPIVVVDENGEVNLKSNISKNITSDPERFEAYIKEIKGQNEPIIINILGGGTQYLYYGNSPILIKLKYYPIAIVLVVFLLIGVVYFFFNTSKASEQNKLWAGMAKETAHQIATPLSSLVGWIEILKTEQVDPSYLVEMDKDITRLKTITERFSKIGSKPSLKVRDIVFETREAYEYLKSRASNLIEFSIETPEKEINVQLNRQLYGWTIENLVKNSIDAMRGKGSLHVKLIEDDKYVKVQVHDTGRGISKHRFNSVFEPGYTSKTRGWGLGLSLARRIIEDYHEGRIKVKESERGKGTIFQISLKKV
ncbi:sensor histidine kinase [Aquimarina agarilytica]|uniref:sensor histidine kinase n=1 Tax=Aquimarina agarilytica TaxID=1087449 RepID=UPI0002898972|nr:HAMP domain-containing sensor histidine kinase [Aquimarina agarilytica]